MTHTLATLLQPWLVSVDLDEFKLDLLNVPIQNLKLDSRQLQLGDTFVAIKGHLVDGRQFIDKAIKLGANAVIADTDADHPHGLIKKQQQTVIVYIDNIGRQLSRLAQQVYGYAPMKLVGITGTNGKTTISQLIAQWIELLNRSCAVMGTTGNGFLSNLVPAVNTTGNAIEIQQSLSQFQQQGAEFTALEISSHGLVQGRVKTLEFAVTGFTNLSRDHLDYHGSMEEYNRAKLSLFTEHSSQSKVINIDDEVGKQWFTSFSQLDDATAVSLRPIAFRLTPNQKALWANQVTYSESGIQMNVDGDWGQANLNAPLVGEFNANNILVAAATLLNLGFSLPQLQSVCMQLQSVIGRMELFQAPKTVETTPLAKIVVDYAHTPDALEKALSALRIHCNGKLWVIFGCGGDRDIGKRSLMANVSEKLADKIIITDDNPRSEKPEAIVDDIIEGINDTSHVYVIHDRYQACRYALEHSAGDDIILVAGKGHEDYQIFSNGTIHYSDRETVQNLLGITK